MKKEMKNNVSKKTAEDKRRIINKSFFTISDVPAFKKIRGEMNRDAARKAARSRKADNA